MYLRVVGAFLIARHTRHFNTELGKTLVQALGRLGSVRKTKSNRNRAVSVKSLVLTHSSRDHPRPGFPRVFIYLLYIGPVSQERISHSTGEAFLSFSGQREIQFYALETSGQRAGSLLSRPAGAVSPAKELHIWREGVPEALKPLSCFSLEAGGVLPAELKASPPGVKKTPPHMHPMLMARGVRCPLPNSISPKTSPLWPPGVSIFPWT